MDNNNSGFAKIKICPDQKSKAAKKYVIENKLADQEVFISIEDIIQDKIEFTKVVLNFFLFVILIINSFYSFI